MKKSSDFLYRLIKSLRRSEKRYFSLFANRHVIGKQNEYLQFYEAIVKQKEADEAKLKAQFPKNFARAKNHLQNLVLESLAEQHATKFTQEVVKKQHHQVKILFQKGFYKECERLLERTINKVRKEQMFSMELLLLELKQDIVTQIKSSDLITIEQIYSEIDECLQGLNRRNHYWILLHRIYGFYFKYSQARSSEKLAELTTLMQHPLLEESESEKAPWELLYYLDIYAIYHFIKGEIESSFACGERLIRVMETNEDLIRLNRTKYFSLLVNHLTDCLELNKHDAFKKGLPKLKALPSNRIFTDLPHLPSQVFHQATILELNYMISNGKFDEAIAQIPTLAQQLKTYEADIALDYLVVIYKQFTYLYLVHAQFEQAIEWNQRLMENGIENDNQQLISLANITNLLIHYELGNFRLLEHLIQSSNRFYRKQQTSQNAFQVEKTFVQFLKKLMNVPNRSEQKAIFQKLKKVMMAFKNDAFETVTFEEYNLFEWVESKIQGRSFRALLEEQAKLTHSPTQTPPKT